MDITAAADTTDEPSPPDPGEAWIELARSFAESNPEAAARALERTDPAEAARVLRVLPTREAGAIAERLPPHTAAALVRHLGLEPTRELLATIAPRQAVLLLFHLEEDHREALLAALPSTEANQLRALLQFPADTAGGMMELQVVSLAVDLTAHEAIESLRRAPKEALYYLYVTDRENHFVGVLTMRELILAAPGEPISPLVRRDVLSVLPSTDREELATLMRQRRLLALPVVDEERRLLGVVTHDRVLDAAQQEAFEDVQKMVGAGGDESALSPLGTSIRRRLPWLCLNLVTAFAAAAVISLFEGLLAQITALAVLLPIVSAIGGNGGAQTLAVAMRGLALQELTPGTGKRFMAKEVLAGTVSGLTMAVLAGAAVWAWSRSPGLALVLALAMIVNLVVACLAGAAIPLALRALGRDPAQSSQIFLTTITDVVGFAAFLGFAALFWRLLT